MIEMAKEFQDSRLRVPEATYPTTTEYLITRFSPVHRERSSKCLVYILAGFVAIFAVSLVFASVVLQVISPEVLLRSAKVMHLSYSTSPTASLNVTMIAHLTISNLNFGHFNYEKSRVTVLYGGMIIGNAELGSARVKARETKDIHVMANLRFSKLLLTVTANLTDDIHSGMLKLMSYAKLSGTVHPLKNVNKKKTAEMFCSMNLNLVSHSFQHLFC